MKTIIVIFLFISNLFLISHEKSESNFKIKKILKKQDGNEYYSSDRGKTWKIIKENKKEIIFFEIINYNYKNNIFKFEINFKKDFLSDDFQSDLYVYSKSGYLIKIIKGITLSEGYNEISIEGFYELNSLLFISFNSDYGNHTINILTK